jgi:sigma-B regulation protein RsbU (phosphoserine phosphatase)
VRDYTAGMDEREMRRLVDRDAPRVYKVLMRDRAAEPPPKSGFKRLLWNARLLFLSVSEKLSPARRAIFAVAIVAFVLAAFGFELETSASEWDFKFDASPLLFVLAVAGFAYLFASELVDRLLVRDEIDVARQLQRDLLPRNDPELAGWRFASAWRTANDVGGDWYGFDVEADGKLRLAVADASGHGMAAGLLAAIANSALRCASELALSPAESARLLHRVLRAREAGRGFLTLFLGRLDPASGELDWTAAAHPSPILRRASGELEELAQGAPPLGVGEESRAETGTVRLEPSDMLVMFTDGLYEALGAAGEPFGWPRVRELVAQGGGATVTRDRLLAAFDAHLGAESPSDDLTLVVVERAG